jgi:hypothetical protein
MRKPSVRLPISPAVRFSLPTHEVRLIVAWLLAFVFASSGGASRAGLILEAGPVTASAGSSGAFDLVLANTNSPGGASYDISSDTIQLALTGLTGVTITGATIDTSIPYIYQTSGTMVLGGSPFVISSTPTSFLASDSEFDMQGFDIISPGQSFGLAQVTYSVASNATAGQMGSISLTNSNLSDFDGNPVLPTLQGGTFTVMAGVPEPSSLALFATGLAMLTAIPGVLRRATISAKTRPKTGQR